MLMEELIKCREDILALAAQYGASNVRVFGSTVNGTDTKDSDIDLLVDLDPSYSLLDLGGLLIDLENLLNRKVDILTEQGLHWYIRDSVLREAKLL